VQHNYPLTYFEPEDRIELDGQTGNQLSVAISTENVVTITAVIKDETANQVLGCGDDFTFDPNAMTIEYGQEYNENLNITD
jgi:hypothetical protein